MVAKKKKVCEPVLVGYDISRWKYLFSLALGKGIPLALAIILSYFIMYKECLNSYCNPVVTVFFAILALMFFLAAGFPVDKIIPHIKLT